MSAPVDLPIDSPILSLSCHLVCCLPVSVIETPSLDG